MTRTAKKDRERRLVDSWRKVEASCPNGELEDYEKPDLLLRAQGATIGIEVTEMFVPTTEEFPPIARENYQDQAVLLAQQLHLKQGGPALDVAVLFSPGTPVTKKTVRSVAENIVALGEANTPLQGAREWKNDGLENVPLWIIRIFRLPADFERTWHKGQWGIVPIGESEWIQRTINDKAAIHYMLTIDNVWILIVSDSSRASSIALFDDEVFAVDYKAPFGRAFFFDSTRRRSIELRIRP
jgi:hypothetical protein